ncbi:MAG: ATP-binding protein [Candidatus Saccharibacteria bacterium]|nr:ATP-binding protein [Candidatus Saccharibacteria bacterium]
MYRAKIEELKTWKKAGTRKPLIVRGARQVGKTWLLKEFGRTEYKNYAYINLEQDRRGEVIFSGNLNPRDIIAQLELISGEKISPDETLIILDEIQEVPRALTSLKYFYEQAPEYHVVASGSLLGLALHEGTSFPVGKVEFLDIFPMTFSEFLIALGKKNYAELLKTPKSPLLSTIHDELLLRLKSYFIIGGMPEVVQNYLDNRDFLAVRKIQKNILSAYENDISKHAPATQIPKILEVMRILPAQLARENRKFIFGMLKTGARAKDYETAIMWLEDVGIVRRVARTNSVNIPVSAYADKDAFKLFMLDTGLLGAEAGLEPETIVSSPEFFQELKGAMAEEFVFQQLVAAGEVPFYYSKDDSRGEIDFILSGARSVLPIEVKSGKNTSSASLRAFLERFPEVPRAMKFSTLENRVEKTGETDSSGDGMDNRIINLALYEAGAGDLLQDFMGGLA